MISAIHIIIVHKLLRLNTLVQYNNAFLFSVNGIYVCVSLYEDALKAVHLWSDHSGLILMPGRNRVPALLHVT